MDLIKKLTTLLMLLVGLGACILGFGIGGVEAFHLYTGVHTFEYPPFIGAGVFIMGGASLIQTQSVKDALSNLTDAIPILRSVRPGGKRKTDPPTDEIEVQKIEEKTKWE